MADCGYWHAASVWRCIDRDIINATYIRRLNRTARWRLAYVHIVQYYRPFLLLRIFSTNFCSQLSFKKKKKILIMYKVLHPKNKNTLVSLRAGNYFLPLLCKNKNIFILLRPSNYFLSLLYNFYRNCNIRIVSPFQATRTLDWIPKIHKKKFNCNQCSHKLSLCVIFNVRDCTSFSFRRMGKRERWQLNCSLLSHEYLPLVSPPPPPRATYNYNIFSVTERERRGISP